MFDLSHPITEVCADTGKYLDVPRYDDGYDLAALDLERVAGVPGVVVRRAERTIEPAGSLVCSLAVPCG